jgi:hypothetical protein
MTFDFEKLAKVLPGRSLYIDVHIYACEEEEPAKYQDDSCTCVYVPRLILTILQMEMYSQIRSCSRDCHVQSKP